MTLTTHAATGIIVAYWAQDPLLGFFAAIISHFILDMIPHGDEYIYWRLTHNMHDPLGRRIAIVDSTAMVALLSATLLIKPDVQNALVLWGALGGILPDLIMTAQTHLIYAVKPYATGAKERFVEIILKIIEPHQKLHRWSHDLVRTPIRLHEGYILQIVFLITYVVLFLYS